jgi:cytochrome P450
MTDANINDTTSAGASGTDDEFAFNAFDPSETQHMWPLMARMRAEQPVTRPMDGFVYLASHADNKAVFRDAKRFSSAEGGG